MAYTANIFTSSIVAVGNFNPAIFTPDWFEKNKLIGTGDAEIAREGSPIRPLIVSHQVTSFESGWFVLQVLENQLTLTSKGVLSPAFKDLAAGIFQLVTHTPIHGVGLNYIGNFKLNNSDEFHNFGDALAPKTVWDTLYPKLMTGMEQLVIRFQDGTRENPPNKKIDEKRITVQRSNTFKFGVVLSLNDHHEINNADIELTPAEQVATIIDKQWDLAWKDSTRVFNEILTKTIESKT